MTYLTHEKRLRGCLLVSIRIFTNNVATVIWMLVFSDICNKFAVRLKFIFTKCTRLSNCTYLGFVLLEAPCEYVLRGLLLSIY